MTSTLSAPSYVKRERPAPARRTVERRNQHGASLGVVVLAPEIFGIEPNMAVLHQVITAQLAAARSGTQSTKTRAEVRGGGAKPFRQKGTGRARQGSTRSPQWTGGGVALGPKPRSYRQRTPKKMIRLALHSALSDRAGEGRIALIDRWTFDPPKTKEALAALAALEVEGRVLVVLAESDGAADRSFGNLPEVQTLLVEELNAYDVLRSDWVVFTDETVPGGVGETVDEPATAKKVAPAKKAGAKKAAAAKKAATQTDADTAAGATTEPAPEATTEAAPDAEAVEAGADTGDEDGPADDEGADADASSEGSGQ